VGCGNIYQASFPSLSRFDSWGQLYSVRQRDIGQAKAAGGCDDRIPCLLIPGFKFRRAATPFLHMSDHTAVSAVGRAYGEKIYHLELALPHDCDRIEGEEEEEEGGNVAWLTILGTSVVLRRVFWVCGADGHTL
jgi:hypothetical protein